MLSTIAKKWRGREGGVSSLTWSEEVGDSVRVATETGHVNWQETPSTSPAIGGERGREGGRK